MIQIWFINISHDQNLAMTSLCLLSILFCYADKKSNNKHVLNLASKIKLLSKFIQNNKFSEKNLVQILESS